MSWQSNFFIVVIVNNIKNMIDVMSYGVCLKTGFLHYNFTGSLRYTTEFSTVCNGVSLAVCDDVYALKFVIIAITSDSEAIQKNKNI